MFGEHHGDVVAYVVLAALMLVFKGLSVARSSDRAIASRLAEINTLLLITLLFLSPNYPWYFLGRHAVCRAVRIPADLGRFDRALLAVRAARLGFLHSKNGDKINSVSEGLLLAWAFMAWRTRMQRTAERRVITMSLSGEAVRHSKTLFDPRRYHRVGHGRAHRGRRSVRRSASIWK